MASMSLTSNEIRAHIVQVFKTMVPNATEIGGSTQIVQDLGLDSLAVMNLMLALEDHFDISIPLDQVAEIVTVDDLIESVVSLTKAERV